MTEACAETLMLRPEHLEALARAARGVAGALIRREGRLQPEGAALYGRFEVLANCGLLEFLERVEAGAGDGEVWVYYALTGRGRILLRWRLGSRALAA